MKKIAFLFLLASLPSCAYISPFVQDFNIISVPAETKIGQQTAAEVSKQMRISTDSAANARVKSIGQSLVRSLPRQDFSYEFFVVEDASPNAFTIPGGKIYVHTGLLKFAQSDEEVAGVIAHEIGHAYMRHPAKSISRQYGADALSQILFQGNNNQLKTLAVKIAQGGILTHYGREDEFEADETGFYILRRGGMTTQGLVRFFTRLQTLQKSGGLPAFLSTHPPSSERVARLQALESGARQPSVIFNPPSAN